MPQMEGSTGDDTEGPQTAQTANINQSLHRPGEASSPTPSSDDNHDDWLAPHWPYLLIMQAAGNIRAGDEDAIDLLSRPVDRRPVHRSSRGRAASRPCRRP